MASFPFVYDTMIESYRAHTPSCSGNTDPRGEIVCYAYEKALQRSMRVRSSGKSRAGIVEPFLHRGITHVGRLQAIERILPDEFLMGLYVVMVDGGNSRRKELFFVSPTSKTTNHASHSHLFADHYSFRVGSLDEKLPLHLHYTSYAPDPVKTGCGAVLHTPLHLPVEFSAPKSSSTFARRFMPGNDEHARRVLPMIALPYGFHNSMDLMGGGGGTKRLTRDDSEDDIDENRARPSSVSIRPREPSFTRLWIDKPLTSMFVVGLKQNDNSYRFSVFCEDSLDRHGSEGRVGASFVMPNRATSRNEGLVQKRVADHLKDVEFIVDDDTVLLNENEDSIFQ